MTADLPAAAKVLVADDVPSVRLVLRSVLTKAGYLPVEAEDGPGALEAARAQSPDCILLDIHMPGLNGLAVLRELHEVDPELPIIMITGYGDVDTAVEAMQLGAYHYLTTPFNNAEVVALVERAVERRRLRCEVRSLYERLDRVAPLTDLLGTSGVITRLIEQIDRAAPTDLSVLITGEEGSGKELVARAIHARSRRADGPFVAIDCGSLPPALVDSELFGHERGAVPGASRQRPGHLDLAAGGTLYLADIGSLPLVSQGRLLRFLEDHHLERLGATERVPLDVRTLAASSIDLRELVGGHLFRRDLYVRLAESTLLVPPLRDRPDDIVYVVKKLLDAANQELGKAVVGPTADALDVLLAHPWPGNLRELRHAIKRAVLLTTDRIGPDQLALTAPQAQAEPKTAVAEDHTLPLRERTQRAVETLERAAILDALRHAGGNKTRAARILGIDYKTLHVKIKKYELRGAEESPNDLRQRRASIG